MNGVDPTGMVWDIFRPSKYDNFIGDASGLIYRKSGEASDAMYRETRQTLGDFDSFMKGTPEKDGDDYFWRSMYRAAFGGCGADHCGDKDGDGIDDSYDTQIGFTYSYNTDNGEQDVQVTDGNGRPIVSIPVSGNKSEERKKEAERRSRLSDAVLSDRIAGEPRPGDDVYACGPCLLALPLLPYISMVTPMVIVGGQAIYRYGLLAMPYIPSIQGVMLNRSPEVLGHIFKSTAGHVNPTSIASQGRFLNLFQAVARNPANLNVSFPLNPAARAAGTQVFTQIYNNGQVWVFVNNGVIRDAGVNAVGKFR